MTKREHEPRRAGIAGDADNSAVDGPMALDLDPVTHATCHVRRIDALGDHPFEPGYLKPGFCHLDVGSVRHELELGEKQRSHSCLAFPSGRQALRYLGSLQDGTSRVRRGPGVPSARLPGREAKNNPDRPTADRRQRPPVPLLPPRLRSSSQI